MVDEDAGEVLADGPVEQGGAYRGVDTAAQSENHAVVAQLCLEFGHGGLDERGRAPFLSAAADVDHEVAQQLLALGGMEHLGVELHGPQWVLLAGIGSKLHVGGRGDNLAIVGDGSDGVAMAHPHLRVRLETLEERVGGIKRLQVGPSILTGVGTFHLSTIGVGDELCAIADTQHRQTAHKLTEVDAEGLRVVHGIGRPTEYHADDRRVVGRKLIVGQDFAERVEFAHAASDELGGLRTEVEDNDFLLHVVKLLCCCYSSFAFAQLPGVQELQEFRQQPGNTMNEVDLYYLFIFKWLAKSSACAREFTLPTSRRRRPGWMAPWTTILSQTAR